MPSGARHTKASLVVAAASATGLFLYSPQASFWCSLGALAGVMLTPDADVDSGNITYHYMRKYAGLPAELLWRIIWKPYSLALPHRGFLSHGPIISTALRLIYLGLWLWPIWNYFDLPIPRLSVNICWWLFGLCLTDSVHAMLDAVDHHLGGRL